jgi:zinc/manganese transport system substrate-binding protein
MISVKRTLVAALVAAVTSAALAGCASSTTPSVGGLIRIVAAENEYGDVATQIGGQYVEVLSINHNPNTDPHTYEVSASVAQSIASASIVIQNGLGYDTYMNSIE